MQIECVIKRRYCLTYIEPDQWVVHIGFSIDSTVSELNKAEQKFLAKHMVTVNENNVVSNRF